MCASSALRNTGRQGLQMYRSPSSFDASARRLIAVTAVSVLLAIPAAAQGPWTITQIGTLGGTAASPADINEAGQVVGSSQTAGGQTHAFLWTLAGGMVDLGTLGGNTSSASAINNVGQIVGSSTTAAGQNHAFLWSAATGMIDLGTLGGTTSSASDINDSGMIAGTSFNASGFNRAVPVDPPLPASRISVRSAGEAPRPCIPSGRPSMCGLGRRGEPIGQCVHGGCHLQRLEPRVPLEAGDLG